MNDFVVLWIGNNQYIIFLNNVFKNMYEYFLVKKNRIFFSLNILLYFFLFSILNSNTIFRIISIIDIVASHFPSNVENEFEFLYVNLNYSLNLRSFLKILIKKEDLMISISNLYNSTAWLEREIWDLFGTKFIYHKDLRRILTDYGFLGHPLLKQFPLIGFIELRYDDSILNILKEAVEMSQMYRLFRFMNPWVIWK